MSREYFYKNVYDHPSHNSGDRHFQGEIMGGHEVNEYIEAGKTLYAKEGTRAPEGYYNAGTRDNSSKDRYGHLIEFRAFPKPEPAPEPTPTPEPTPEPPAPKKDIVLSPEAQKINQTVQQWEAGGNDYIRAESPFARGAKDVTTQILPVKLTTVVTPMRTVSRGTIKKVPKTS